MNETDLREELERAGAAFKLGAPPSFATLVTAQRRRRKRIIIERTLLASALAGAFSVAWIAWPTAPDEVDRTSWAGSEVTESLELQCGGDSRVSATLDNGVGLEGWERLQDAVAVSLTSGQSWSLVSRTEDTAVAALHNQDGATYALLTLRFAEDRGWYGYTKTSCPGDSATD